MVYVLYHCFNCQKEVSAPANPEMTVPADESIEEKTVVCPACKAVTKIELSARIKPKEGKPKKKRGRPRKKSPDVPLVVPDMDPPQEPPTEGEKLFP